MILSLNIIFCNRMTVKTEFIRVIFLTVASRRPIPARDLIGLLAAKRYFIRFGLKHISRTRR